MSNMILTSEPITLLIVTLLTVIFIVLGRRTESPIFPVVVVCYSLGLLIYHSVKLNGIDPNIASSIYFSIAADMVILFLGFISYLWIDDISAKKRNKKNYSEALSWFWDKL